MKRYLILLTLVLMPVLFLAGCNLEEVTRESELKASYEVTFEELDSTFSNDSVQYSLVAEYLDSWANKNKLTVLENNSDHMVITNPATKGYEDYDPIVFQCSVATDDFSTSIHPLSIGLTSLLGPESHGDIHLIITEINDGMFTGAASVDSEYCNGDIFINITDGSDMTLNKSGSYEMTGTMTTPLKLSSPAYKNAFAITMTISGSKDPFDLNSNYPNPVSVIGRLLATEQSSGQLFNLASFECESENGYIPTSATAIVTVDDNDIESFTKKFDNSYDNVKEDFEALNDNFVYTMTETRLPEQVIDNRSSDNIISLMYMLQTGVYNHDEEEDDILSVSDITSISTSDGKFAMTTAMRSTDKQALDEISAEFLTTSGLCDILYESSDSNLTWSSNEKNTAVKFLSESLGIDNIKSATLKSGECDIFYSKGISNIVSYSCDANHGEEAMLTMLHMLENAAQ